jgi:hypothetical protein
MIDAPGLISAAYSLIAVATVQTALYIFMVKRLPWPPLAAAYPSCHFIVHQWIEWPTAGDFAD